MRISRPRVLASLLCLLVAIAGAVAQRKPPMTELPHLEFSVVSSTNDPTQSPDDVDRHATRELARLRERLSDPHQRERLRAEQRAHLQSMHPELGEALDVHSETADRIIDLLADQQMSRLEQWYARRPDRMNPAAPEDPHDEFVRVAAEENRLKQQLADLLGAEHYERYVEYVSTLPERRQVTHFEGQLEQDDKLSPDQRVRLTHILDRLEGRRVPDWGPPRNTMPFPAMMHLSKDEREEELLKQNIASNEDLFRHMKERSRVLLGRLRDVLTPSQLDAYARMEAFEIDGQRKHVQQMRVRAGMNPEFDEAPSKVAPTKRSQVTGQVRLELGVRVNASDVVSTVFVVENGNATPALQVREGLWIEATPSLYENGLARLDVSFYEQRGAQRHRIRGGMSMGMTTRPEVADMPRGFSSGGTVVSGGSKSYAIWVEARVSHAP